MKNSKKIISFLFFVLGVALFVLLVRKVGLNEITTQMSKLGWGVFYVFAFPLTWTLVQSFAWWRILTDDGSTVSLWHIILVKITGEAINNITPISFVGGDPYRIYLLQKKTGATESAASVVIDRTMFILAICLTLLTSLVLAWFTLPLPGSWRILFPVFTVGFFVFFVGLVLFQKRGMLQTVSRLMIRFKIKSSKLASWQSRLEMIDEQVGRFYDKNKRHFFEIMMLQYLARLLGAVEIYLIASLMHININMAQCLFLTSLTILINLAFFFVPGSMGVMESGYSALFYLLKLNPAHGVTIQIIRRIRTLFWTGVGLLIVALYKPKSTRQTLTQ